MSYLDNLYQVPVNEDTNILNEIGNTAKGQSWLVNAANKRLGDIATRFSSENRHMRGMKGKHLQPDFFGKMTNGNVSPGSVHFLYGKRPHEIDRNHPFVGVKQNPDTLKKFDLRNHKNIGNYLKKIKDSGERESISGFYKDTRDDARWMRRNNYN